MAVGAQPGALQDFLDEIFERKARAVGDLREEARRRHPRQRVDLEDHLVSALADHQVDAARALATERLMRQRGEPQHGAVALGRQPRRQVIVGSAARVLVVEVVEAALGDDLDRADRLAVQHRHRDLLAVHEPFHQHVVVEAQRVLDRQLELQLVARHARPERGSFAARLDDDRETECAMKLEQVLAAVGLDEIAGGGRQVGEAEDLLRLRLVHGQRRRQDPGTRIRDAEQLQHALDAAILAVAAVQRQEGDVDARLA